VVFSFIDLIPIVLDTATAEIKSYRTWKEYLLAQKSYHFAQRRTEAISPAALPQQILSVNLPGVTNEPSLDADT
jgi:hypothetical protein